MKCLRNPLHCSEMNLCTNRWQMHRSRASRIWFDGPMGLWLSGLAFLNMSKLSRSSIEKFQRREGYVHRGRALLRASYDLLPRHHKSSSVEAFAMSHPHAKTLQSSLKSATTCCPLSQRGPSDLQSRRTFFDPHIAAARRQERRIVNVTQKVLWRSCCYVYACRLEAATSRPSIYSFRHFA